MVGLMQILADITDLDVIKVCPSASRSSPLGRRREGEDAGRNAAGTRVNVDMDRLHNPGERQSRLAMIMIGCKGSRALRSQARLFLGLIKLKWTKSEASSRACPWESVGRAEPKIAKTCKATSIGHASRIPDRGLLAQSLHFIFAPTADTALFQS